MEGFFEVLDPVLGTPHAGVLLQHRPLGEGRPVGHDGEVGELVDVEYRPAEGILEDVLDVKEPGPYAGDHRPCLASATWTSWSSAVRLYHPQSISVFSSAEERRGRRSSSRARMWIRQSGQCRSRWMR